MRTKKIPPEKYTDNVRKIVETPKDDKYVSMILDMPDEDLETAIAVMESHDVCKEKTSVCRSELRNRRSTYDTKNLGAISPMWADWFSGEWIKTTKRIRKAAGHEC